MDAAAGHVQVLDVAPEQLLTTCATVQASMPRQNSKLQAGLGRRGVDALCRQRALVGVSGDKAG